MAQKKLYRGRAAQGAALLIANVLFFGMTDPSRAPSFLFGVAFLLLSVSIYWGASNLYRLASWYGLPLKHRKRAVLASTGVIMALTALQSTGQLGPRDVILLLPFVAVGYFYISYQYRKA